MEARYVDRRGGRRHSLNVMVVTDSDLYIRYTDPYWPGSTHDACVLRRSRLQENLSAGQLPFNNCIFLADSGYGCTEHILTSIMGVNLSPGEEKYNRWHRGTRFTVEQAIGIFKNRMRILKHCNYSPEFSSEIVRTCAGLHNLALRFQPLDDDEREALVFEDQHEEPNVVEAHSLNPQYRRRNQLVSFFEGQLRINSCSLVDQHNITVLSNDSYCTATDE